MTPNAKIYEQELDPQETLDYSVDITNILQEDEEMGSYTLQIPVESELYGLTLGTEGYEDYNEGNVITFWLSVQGTPDDDVTLPVELTITTDSNPPRVLQRTLAVKVTQL